MVEAMKATQRHVDITTPLGTSVWHVPSSMRAVMASEQKEQWLDADRTAHMAILAAGNEMARIDSVPKDVPIAPCVTQRGIKKDQATGRLEKLKSRHCADGGRLEAFRIKLGLPPRPSATVNIIDDLALKLFLSDLAGRRRSFMKIDIGNAYAKATRLRPVGYMRVPSTLKDELRDADGNEMVYLLRTPLWGEAEAGFEWDIELDRALRSLGWLPCEGVPAMYYFNSPDSDARLVKIVDDLAVSESSKDMPIGRRTLALLKERFKECTYGFEPTSFAGFKLRRSADLSKLWLSQPEKIREAVRAHMPELLTGSEHGYDLLKGKKLQDALDDLVLPKDRRAKLNAEQKEVQKITGAAKYFERGTCPRLTPMVHCLSCIMSFPPPGALQVARSVLAYAYTHIDDEIMYSDAVTPAREIIDGKTKLDMTERAPKQLEATADASNKVPHKIGILITRCGASVLHLTKLVGNAGTSTMEVESKATIKASELVEYAVTVERALGCPSEEPALLLTDSLSNQRVVTNSGSAAQARHLLAHMEGLKARQDAKILRVAHITDPENVSDFLTKGCDANKRERSVRYALGL
jgi:hypothetical protein